MEFHSKRAYPTGHVTQKEELSSADVIAGICSGGVPKNPGPGRLPCGGNLLFFLVFGTTVEPVHQHYYCRHDQDCTHK